MFVNYWRKQRVHKDLCSKFHLKKKKCNSCLIVEGRVVSKIQFLKQVLYIIFIEPFTQVPFNLAMEYKGKKGSRKEMNTHCAHHVPPLAADAISQRVDQDHHRSIKNRRQFMWQKILITWQSTSLRTTFTTTNWLSGILKYETSCPTYINSSKEKRTSKNNWFQAAVE